MCFILLYSLGITILNSAVFTNKNCSSDAYGINITSHSSKATLLSNLEATKCIKKWSQLLVANSSAIPEPQEERYWTCWTRPRPHPRPSEFPEAVKRALKVDHYWKQLSRLNLLHNKGDGRAKCYPTAYRSDDWRVTKTQQSTQQNKTLRSKESSLSGSRANYSNKWT